MKKSDKNIDISENLLRRTGKILDILLTDRTTGKRIIWATDSYLYLGPKYAPDKRITPSLITGEFRKVIQPRVAKSLKEQRRRTKDKAEVFTPLKIVEQINNLVDKKPNTKNWQKYVQELKMEITCGEGPFISSRYNPTAHTKKVIAIKNRVGFLDKKLQVVSKFCTNKKEWMFWAKEAFKASYGFDWQGDNVLLTRENLLYTFIDFYEDKFSKKPSLKEREEIAKIISWNIFQMDGLKYVVPMSCKNEKKIIKGAETLFGKEEDRIEEKICEGCLKNNFKRHNGTYVKIKDWKENKIVRFVDLIL